MRTHTILLITLALSVLSMLAVAGWAGSHAVHPAGGSRQVRYCLYTVNADGSHVTAIVPASIRPASPAWGFVGETIVFQGYRPGSGHSEIMRVEADGSGLVLLTFNEIDFDYAPGWLPGW